MQFDFFIDKIECFERGVCKGECIKNSPADGSGKRGRKVSKRLIYNRETRVRARKNEGVFDGWRRGKRREKKGKG